MRKHCELQYFMHCKAYTSINKCEIHSIFIGNSGGISFVTFIFGENAKIKLYRYIYSEKSVKIEGNVILGRKNFAEE